MMPEFSAWEDGKGTVSLSSLRGKRMDLVLNMLHLGCYRTPNRRCQSEAQ